jgi:O-antigen ligase
MVVFSTAVFQTMSQPAAEGAYNSILFGDFSAYLACAAGAAAVGARNRPAMALLFLVSAGLSTYASVMSGTRGAWIGLYLGLLFLLVVWLFSVFRHSRSALPLSLSVFGGVLLVLLFSLHPVVSARSLDAFQTFGDFFFGGNPNTSVGYRLQMWEAAYKIWLINPVLGSGLGDYSRDLSEMIRLGKSAMNAHFGEAHSLYFEFLGTTGLLGLMALMAGMFVCPLLTFLGVGRGGGLLRLLDSPASLHGVCLVIAFSSFGISQNWLGRSSISSVFFLCLALFLATVVYERREDGIPEKGQGT